MVRKGRRQATRHGYIVIDKPVGWTSHDVVARVRRLVDERRVGHAGTLDPAATGVLPVAIGLATRTVEYLAAADKAYRASIRFGITTDSADAEGDVTSTVNASHLQLSQINEALPAIRGDIMQRPPMHSAIRVDGRRLYDLARKGEEIEVAARPVTIHQLDVADWSPPDLTLDITCSKGTYIRSIARDLGELVGTGAHLATLRRTRTGPFTLTDAMTLDDLADRLESDGWSTVAMAPDAVLDHLRVVELDTAQAMDWSHGKKIIMESAGPAAETIRAYDGHGHWLGIGQTDQSGHLLQPVKVIPMEL